MTVFILLCTYDDIMRLIHRIKKRGMEQKYLMVRPCFEGLSDVGVF